MESGIERQHHWRWKIALYLFLAGAGAGAYIGAVLADIFWTNGIYLSKNGVLLGTALVIAGTPLLILDLGRQRRFLRAGFNPRTAWIGRGFYVLSIFIILGLMHIGFWIWPFKILETERSFRVTVGIINGVFACATAMYTGLLLKSMKPIQFWNTSLIVVLFFLSALSTGSISVLLSSINHFAEAEGGKVILGFLIRGDLILILGESLVLGLYLFTMFRASSASKKSVLSLIRGDLKLLFWGGIVICGLAIPVFLKYVELIHSELVMPELITISCLFILSGGLLLRYGILAAGVRVDPLLPKCR